MSLNQPKQIFKNIVAQVQLIPESFSVFGLRESANQKLHFVCDDSEKLIRTQMLVLPDNAIVAEMVRKP